MDSQCRTDSADAAAARGEAVELDTIVQADCIEWLGRQKEPFADLIFADPPFNIGYQYDVYEDRKAYDEYHAWTEQWMSACCGVLKPTGTFWVAIGDEYAAEVRMIGRGLGLTLRNWVIWHYTFGQNTKHKFARSHAHLFYFVKDPKDFTFNDEAVRVFSDRQREYHDRRANPKGKIPDDTWSEFPRVCGTFGEREGWHPCQMPETVLSRIVRACSRAGDVVFDPFAGSGTTLVAAKKLSRRYLGTELSENYADGIRQRLANTEPIADNPAAQDGAPWPAGHLRELQGVYMTECVETRLLHEHPHLLAAFTGHLNWRLANAAVAGEYSPTQVWAQLETLRKRAALAKVKVHAVEPVQGRIRGVRRTLFD
ncbi:MAG TPA: DNA methyltransferase [Phycisphaerae bacterium]|nr:DNA methyltransferase [Phycisphaerae bacterium]